MDPPKDGMYTGEQFVQCERFRDVVIRSETQTLDLVVFLAPCREDDDSGTRPVSIQLTAYIEAIDAGQRQVQEDEVWIKSVVFSQCPVPVGCERYIESLVKKVVTEHARQRCIVFDNEDFPLHGRVPFFAIGRRISAIVPLPLLRRSLISP